MEELKTKINESLLKLEEWVEGQGYRGYEPFDGLSSYLRFFTFKNLFLERVLQQAVRLMPWNIRPLIGISKKESTKGRGCMAAGYLTLYRTTGKGDYLEKARACLRWLDHNKAPGFDTHSWGNHFAFSSRAGRHLPLAPIIVWTAQIGQTFADAFEITKDRRHLEILASICDWILALPREKTASGTCISYVPHRQSSVHNSNMLGAALLARASHILKNPAMLQVAKDAIEYSCSRQLADGSWWYGEAQNLHWVDNFHTGYNLDSLKCYIQNSGTSDYRENLRKGFEFYKSHFFLSDGTPRYYADKTFPIDSQCVSQSVETLANFAADDPEALPLALKVAGWTMDHMRNRKTGHFYFRIYPRGLKVKTPMLHWAQATMYKAFALLYSKL